MNRKSLSLALLGIVFGIGAMTADGPAVFAGSRASSILVTLGIIVLLFIGVFAWYRIVKAAHEAQVAGEQLPSGREERPPGRRQPEHLAPDHLAVKRS